MHLKEQTSINNMLLGPSCLNLGLISFHTLSMFFRTNDRSLFDGWGIHVSKHFSTPHINIGLSFNKPPNNKSTMGFKLDSVVDDQMPIVKLITTQLQELLGNMKTH